MRVNIDQRAILLGIARASSAPAVASALTAGIARDRMVVLARAWLANPGAKGTLELAGSAGTPSGGGSYTQLDGEFRVISDEKLADIAATRGSFVVRGVRGDEEWLINAAWAGRQGVRGFIGMPLIADDHLEGVLAIFDRLPPTDEALAQLQLVVDVAAGRAADLRDRPPSPLATSVPTQGDGGAHEGRRSPEGTEVLTRDQLRCIEKANIQAALERTGGKVFGVNGAAALLRMRPTTLASRIKALGIGRRS